MLVAERDKDKTTITTNLSTNRYTRMPFGLQNAPATFQRALHIALSSVRWPVCLIYLKSVRVFLKAVTKHITYLDTVLTLLQDAGTSLKLRECFFFQPQVRYLGHVVELDRLSVAQKATKALQSLNSPHALIQLRSFLRACNDYRRFVKAFSKIARPLTEMARKDASPDSKNPATSQREAFVDLSNG